MTDLYTYSSWKKIQFAGKVDTVHAAPAVRAYAYIQSQLFFINVLPNKLCTPGNASRFSEIPVPPPPPRVLLTSTTDRFVDSRSDTGTFRNSNAPWQVPALARAAPTPRDPLRTTASIRRLTATATPRVAGFCRATDAIRIRSSRHAGRGNIQPLDRHVLRPRSVCLASVSPEFVLAISVQRRRRSDTRKTLGAEGGDDGLARCTFPASRIAITTRRTNHGVSVVRDRAAAGRAVGWPEDRRPRPQRTYRLLCGSASWWLILVRRNRIVRRGGEFRVSGTGRGRSRRDVGPAGRNTEYLTVL